MGTLNTAVAAIRPAAAEDFADVCRLLRSVDLPHAGLEAQYPNGFVVAVAPTGSLLGVAGLEVYATDGLLRSVAVTEAARGVRLGAALVADRLRWAATRGVVRVFLLTTTAADFFRAHGFADVDRETAGAALQRSAEFASACPASADCLVRDLAG